MINKIRIDCRKCKNWKITEIITAWNAIKRLKKYIDRQLSRTK